MKTQIFVINLERCFNKKEKMLKQLTNNNFKNINFEFIKAIDGRNLTNKILATRNADILKEWKDPYSGRNTTWGEVGCTLSHILIYEKCIEENIDIAIILEDDVLIPDNFGEKLNNILEKLKKIDWELCYLGRKPIDEKDQSIDDKDQSIDDKDQSINDFFVKPGYSYWTCGYIVNLKGMEKIINSNIKKNLIAADEVLPILGNVSPYKKFYNYYNINEPLKMYSLKNLIVKPESAAFNYSDTENSKEIDVYNEDLLILATGTNMVDGLKRFINSCKVYGLKYKIMGLGEKWNGGNMSAGVGGGQKINFLMQTLSTIDEEQLILVTDSYDVIMTSNSEEIIKKYKTFQIPIVFAAESCCWPNKNLASIYPSSPTANKYLNSGGFIGKVKDIKKILPLNTISSNSDDQLYYSNKFLSQDGEKLIKLDYNCDIFQCLNNAESELEILYGKSRIKNKITNTEPCQIHGNGPQSRKNYLNRLESYLMKNWTNVWGYNNKNMLQTIPKNIKIMIFIEINIPACSIFTDLIETINTNVETINTNVETIKNIETKYYSTSTFFHKNINTNIIKENNIEKLRNKVLEIAKEEEYDYLWFIDSTYVITNKNILKNMILQNKSIVGPFINKKKQLWSNFWGAVDENGWYKNSEDYNNIVNRERRGCWNIPYLAGNYLINKETIQKIQNFYTNDYNSNFNVYMKFSKNCRDNNIFLYVENLDKYGYIFEGLKDKIPLNAIHKDFYLFETNKDKWAKKYFHPDFYNIINNWKLLKFTEPCKFAFDFPFVNDLFCEHLLDEVNNINEWSTGGHKKTEDKRISGIENIPTVDIHMKQIGFRKQWESIIHTYIAPLVSYLYSPFKTKGLNIAFVVKYEMDNQKHLNPHHDSATYSLVITLNRPNIDFEGGGTRFVKQNVTVKGKKGYCTIHPGKLTHYHEGLPITKGKRFIMVSFIN